MAQDRTMLVVDDEEVVCQACRRIFSRQGFQVESNTDARQGLALAAEKDYTIVLLDIKMPNIDGIEFLERLRQKKFDVPVLIITGYPSIPNAAAAMRLGACDYVTKPFTSEEITWAVQRVLSTRQIPAADGEKPLAEDEEAATPAKEEETLFWDESWVRLAVDESASVGAVLPGLRGATVTEVRLPRIGEVVYQGLPLAGVVVAGKPLTAIPSPVSGVVAAVNDQLARRPELLASRPCEDGWGGGWIACICTTRHEELTHCRRRRILLVNADPASSAEQAQKLKALGCQVQQVADRETLLAALADTADRAVFLDATSLSQAGPQLVELTNRQAPNLRVVVVGSTGGAGETAYRQHKIFYYAVEPFSDNEIADILTAVFQTREVQPPKGERQKEPSEPISGISITNRNQHKVELLAAPGLLWGNEGVGLQITQRLLSRMLPVVVAPGEAYLTPANIFQTAAGCDRVMVLLARDAGRLPGSLSRDAKPEFDVDPGDAAGKVAILTVQPDALGGFACLDARTVSALADHIVWDMASY
jgi:DNA-binding NtrC family response regulator/glycine cleavage system H lipoate-binding protein